MAALNIDDDKENETKNELEKQTANYIFEESTNGKVELLRPIYYYENTVPENAKTIQEQLIRGGRYIRKTCCPTLSIWQLIISFLPPLEWLPTYPWKNYFVSDILAGLTVGFMAVPEGLAYSKLAGMPPVYGLYTNTIPSLVYVLLGTSRHAIFGPITAISLLISAIRYKHIPCEDCWKSNTTINGTTTPAGPDVLPNLTPIELGSTVAFLVGFYLILMGIFKLSIITNYLSDQVIGGFTIGVAVQVAAGQLESIFGIPMPKRNGVGKAIMNFIDLFRMIGHTNVITLTIFLSCFVFLLIVKLLINPRVQPKLRFPLPGDLVVVICGTLASYYGDVHEKYGVKIVNTIPAGLPQPVLPRFDVMKDLWLDSIAPAAVTFSLSLSLTKLFAKRNGYKIDPTQEFYAYGAMNMFGSFFQCINAGQSMARSLVCERSGGKTQLCALWAVVVGIIVILVIAPFMETLPSCVLSSIVMTACVMVISNIREVKNLYHCSKIDLSTYVITVIAVIGLDVTYGLAVGVGWALITVLLRSERSQVKSGNEIADVLYSSTDMALDSTVNPKANLSNEFKIVQLNSPIYYANAEKTKNKILRITDTFLKTEKDFSNEEPIEKVDYLSTNERHKILIIDMAGVPFMDTMGVNALKDIKRDMEKECIYLFLSGCTISHRELMRKVQLFGNDSSKIVIFPTLIDAISYAKEFCELTNIKL